MPPHPLDADSRLISLATVPQMGRSWSLRLAMAGSPKKRCVASHQPQPSVAGVKGSYQKGYHGYTVPAACPARPSHMHSCKTLSSLLSSLLLLADVGEARRPAPLLTLTAAGLQMFLCSQQWPCIASRCTRVASARTRCW